MFDSIRIKGMGPYRDDTIELDPSGVTEIRGPSMSGKTTVLRAMCYALHGTDEHGRALSSGAVNDDCKRIEVELHSAKGTVISRTRTRSGSSKRSVNGRAYSTEEDIAAALGPLGREVRIDKRTTQLARLIMAPMSWRSLAAGNARGLRDLLDQITPADDPREEISRLMDGELEDTDPIDIATAERSRRNARSARDRTAGALDHAREVQRRTQRDEIAEVAADVTDARAVLSARDAWAVYGAAECHQRTIDIAKGDLARWQTRRDAIGDQPHADGGLHAEAVEARAAAETAYQLAAREMMQGASTVDHLAESDIDHRVPEEDAALRALDQAEDTHKLAQIAAESPDADVCPTCHRDGWHHAHNHALELRDALDVARLAAEKAAKNAYNVRLCRQKELDKRRADAASALSRAQAAEQAEAEALELAVQMVDETRGGMAELETWRAAISALGVAPDVPPDVDRDPKPASTRPTDDDVRQAREAIADHVRQAGAAEQRARAVRDAEASVVDAAAMHERDKDKADHFDALVDAIREAPSVRLRRNLGQLGDLGPVSIHVPGTGSATVEVRVDGRAWDLASSGERVLADLHFRLALRRAYRMRWLPIFVDQVQDWSGSWPDAGGPDAGGPVVMLITES